MNFFIRKPWDLPPQLHTPESVYRQRRQHRRQFLAELGLAGIGATLGLSLAGCQRGSDEEIKQAGTYESKTLQNLPQPAAPEQADTPDDAPRSSPYPARRNTKFEYGRPETDEAEAARYTNFYEFTGPYTKASWRYVGKFQPDPWTIEVSGLCAKPRTFDMSDLYRLFSFEERAYRHRCVETWAMCIPWTGFPLRDLLKLVEPLPAARYVRFETFNRPEEAPYMADDPGYPWPYTEGLTLAEATNELTLLATGIYGHPLPKQHGAPIRLVVPWKYGFKGIKSVVKISLTQKEPATFWNTISPTEYKFGANVEPEVPHPRWSQATEWMLGTRERFPTQLYNGYGEFVGSLYAS